MKSESILKRVAAAPISWGICEVPGWGFQMSPDRVLGEMKELGFSHTELGSAGWLPSEPDAITQQLAAHDMNLLGAFIPLVLHEQDQAETARAEIAAAAKLLQASGATHFIGAPVMSADWGEREPLSDEQWDHMVMMLDVVDQVCEEHSLQHVLHEHHGIVIEPQRRYRTPSRHE